MLNVKRWNELRAMDDDQLNELWKELGFTGTPSRLRIMAEENRRADPEWAERLDAAFGFTTPDKVFHNQTTTIAVRKLE